MQLNDLSDLFLLVIFVCVRMGTTRNHHEKNGESHPNSLFSTWHFGRGKVACQAMFLNYSPSRITDSKLKNRDVLR